MIRWDAVAPVGGGSFTGTHASDDLLVQAEFTQGGAINRIDVYQWVGDGSGSAGNGNIDLIQTGVDCAAPAPIADDWPFEDVEIFNFRDGLHLFVDAEEVILSSEEPEFVTAMLEAAVVGASPSSPTQALDNAETRARGSEQGRRRRGAHEAESPSTES